MKKINSYDEIIEHIKYFQYVSFDLFDTLIKRDVAKPSDIFSIIEKKGNPNFKDKRIDSERNARKKSVNNEITLHDIYETLNSNLKNDEIILEKQLCFANLCLKPIYEYCLKHKKTIIVTTDIYLDRLIIADILAKCGYENYDYLFVSSEHKCMKADGGLFDVAIAELKINPRQLIHIGDNYKSDYLIPKQKGIESVWVDGHINNLQYGHLNDDLEHDYWYTFTNNHLRKVEHSYNTGYECYGPLLYGFTKWLISKFEEDSIDNVYFLSRDGQIIKEVFDSIYKGNIKSHYLLVSRRALLIPSLKLYESVEDFINSYHFPYRFSAEKMCHFLGCDNEDWIGDILEGTGTQDYVFFRDNLSDNSKFESVFNSIVYKTSEQITKQYELLNKYLKQEEFDGKVAIVDIGWHGNMQKNLNALTKSFGINADIKGYYVAMTPSEELSQRNDMHGYLFDSFHDQKLDYQEQLFTSAFELLFTGNHGTVLDYSLNSKVVTANFGTFEIKDKNSLELVKNYQRGAMDFCNDARENAVFDNIDVKYVTEVLFTQFLNPSLQDAKEWGRVTHDDNGTKTLVTFRKKNYYVLHPRQLIKDYKNSLWKIGFLKQLFVIEFPYYKLILLLNTIKRGWKKRF